MRLHILLFLALFDSRNYDYHIQASVCQATHQAFTCWASHRKYGLCTFKQVHPKQAHVEQVWECTWRVRPSGFELVHVEQGCVVPNEHIIKDGDPQCAPSMQTCSQQRCTSEYVDPLYVSTWQKDAITYPWTRRYELVRDKRERTRNNTRKTDPIHYFIYKYNLPCVY